MSGFSVTIFGMGIVFLILSVLAVISWGLGKIFKVEEPVPEKGREKEGEEKEAVIALALAYHTRRKGKIHIQNVNETVWMQQTRVYK